MATQALLQIYDTSTKQYRSLTTDDLASIGGGGGGDATAANQVLGLTALDSIYDALQLVGTEATSADILAAVNSLGDGATLADLATALAPLATEATQQDVLAALEAQAIDVGLIQTNVALLVPDVDAMKDSLASINGKIPASPATTTNQTAIFDRLDPLWSAAYTSLVGTKTAKTITLFGRRTSATFNNATQYHDLYSYLTTDIAGSDLAGSEALEVVSSSVNDTSAGTGARTLAYAYIDALAGDIETVATVTMNGTTPVALGAGVRAKNIQWLEVRTAGSTNHNDGTITLRTAGAGTTWEQIPAFQRRSLSARYMVPAGYTAFVKALRFTAISQRMDIALLATESESGDALTNVYVPHHLSNVPSNVAGPAIETPYHRFSAGTRLKISAIAAATAGSPIAEAEFTLLTVQN